eukprot:TRINITY_DN59978_c0_g1_i1.p1 TRINITY_DN59978_c0_g1~~TRINITY_DN59978_c0_g1_i1.p1  ORF type:complete len:105 (+),score=5.65 TRINITY_DN59978_c0_g1_i1:327-641(+)
MSYICFVLNGGWIEARRNSVVVLESVCLIRREWRFKNLEKGHKSHTSEAHSRRPSRYNEIGLAIASQSSEVAHYREPKLALASLGTAHLCFLSIFYLFYYGIYA